MLTFNGRKINTESIALTTILVGEICFFTIKTIYMYWLLTCFGMIVAILNIRRFSLRKIRTDSFCLWTFLVYFLYFVYGFFFLQRGDFPWDTVGYRFVEVISLYILISDLFKTDIEKFQKAIVTAGILSLIYLVCMEGTAILLGGMRIGNSLSGNVNTVGYNFGMLSTIVMWFYCQEKKKKQIVLFSLFSVIMLLTGSKKTLIMLLANFLMYFWNEKKKASGWLKAAIVLIFALYLIFNVSYFYNIIGYRIDAMFQTIIGGKSSATYSYSTDIRELMIGEAFDLFKHKPILGGGWNYFYANTITDYEYSHCNYMEMLCSFGIVGTLLFYSKRISYTFYVCGKRMRAKHNQYLKLLIIVLMVDAFFLDWAAVTFSAQCIWYLPVIISAAAVDLARKNKSI